jgi:hypothetical protein
VPSTFDIIPGRALFVNGFSKSSQRIFASPHIDKAAAREYSKDVGIPQKKRAAHALRRRRAANDRGRILK